MTLSDLEDFRLVIGFFFFAFWKQNNNNEGRRIEWIHYVVVWVHRKLKGRKKKREEKGTFFNLVICVKKSFPP